MSNNPNAGSFFTTENGQPTSSGTAVAGFFERSQDVFVDSVSFQSGILSVHLNNGVTRTVDIGSVNSHVSGISFDGTNRRLTVNRSDGQSFSATIPEGETNFTDDGGATRVLDNITFSSDGEQMFLNDSSGNTRTFSGGGGGSTIEINNIEVENPDFRDTVGDRGVVFTNVGGLIGARANSDSAKQDVLAEGAFVDGDKTKLDGIPDFVASSNLPRLTANLVGDREYVIWVTNNTGSPSNTVVTSTVSINGRPASTITGATTVAAGRTSPLYVTWTPLVVETIQNNDPNTDARVDFTSPDVDIRVATGEDAQSGSTLTGTQIITAINEASTTGRINADHVTQPTLDPSESENIARITLDNGDIAVPNSVVNLIGRGGITVDFDSANARDITFSGTSAPHAQLRTGLTISPNTFDRSDGSPGSGTITGTPTASIADAATGDVVNSITINSAHASYLDNNLNIRTTGTPRFTYSILTTAPAQTIVFTCVFTVNSTIDGVTADHQVTHTGNLLVRQAPITFRYGTFSQAQFDMRDSLSAAQIATTLTDTADGVVYPYSQEYTGTAIPTNTYAALFVPDEDGVVTSVRSEGFVLNFERRSGVDVGGVTFSLYTVTAPLSEGTHTIEWRT